MAEQATLNEQARSGTGAALPIISGYELLRENGRGPKAVVYKARRLFENDTVAVKLFHKGICDRAMAAKLEAGVEKTTGLKHPGILGALGFGSENGHSFLVLEYASGESLSNFLFRQQQFPPAKALSVVLHFARTLRYAAEKGFHHGRLHPGRIILGRNTARIAGVGMGERPEHAAWSVQFSHFFEPLIYTAPEAMPSKPFPEKNIGAVDVFSLGAILFHLLTCSAPYKGNDEGSLETERRNLRGALAWPGDSRRAYAPAVVELVEAMLNADATKRPNMDNVIQTLTALQSEAHKSGAEAWHPAESGTHGATSSHTGMGVFGDVGKSVGTASPFAAKASSSSAVVASAVITHADSPRASRRTPVIVARRTGADVFFSTLLFCMTATAFLCVVYLTAQPYLPEKFQVLKKFVAKPAEATAATNATPASGVSNAAQTNGTDAAAKAPETPVDPNKEAEAARKLDKLREMLREGQLAESAGVAKILRNISELAGPNSQTGISALVQAGDVESRVAARKAVEAQAPTAAKTEPPKPEPPVKTEAPAPKAPDVPPVKAADLPKPIPGVATAITQARANLKYFGYSKAKEIMEQFAVKGDAEQKRIASDYQTLMNYEEGLYERSRAKLLDQIKRDPKHASNLQLFPRKDDPVGDDIIDFDDKGLHVLVRGGPNRGVKIMPWDKFAPAALLNLLIPLTTPNSVDDQLGLAIFSFNRGLKGEVDNSVFIGKAEQLPNGKEKATAISDIIAKITRALDAP